MAEVGLVVFARTAYQVAQVVMPAYRSRYSKHIFTQPQLVAVLCLMRYEDWTFREAEVRLAEHQELRKALELEQVPDYTTLYRFLRRLDETLLDQALVESVKRYAEPEEHRSEDRKAIVAVDATGLAPGAISTFFVNRRKDRGQGLPWRYWLKWVVVVDLSRQMLVAQLAKRGPYNDCAQLRPLVDTACEAIAVQTVLADAEFDSERNHRHIRQVHGCNSVIPAKRGKASWKRKGIRAEMQAQFPKELYGRRALIETVFSVVKRKLSARAPGRSLETQRLQALLLGLAYNIYRLVPHYQPDVA